MNPCIETLLVVGLSVNDNAVAVGDPPLGQATLSADEFRRQWRSVGVVLRRSKK